MKIYELGDAIDQITEQCKQGFLNLEVGYVILIVLAGIGFLFFWNAKTDGDNNLSF